MRAMRKFVTVVFAALLAVFVVIQFVPGPPRDNPPSMAPARFPADVEIVMRKACMDCHSNETHWPWYSAVAPVSWYVATDVLEARSHLNFSNWEALPEETRLDILTKLWNEVVERRMPHKQYALVHPKVELNVEEKKVIRDWAFSLVEELSAPNPSGTGE